VTTDTAARILEHGAVLVLRDGVAAVRIADVAHAAGVSRQAVYLHFPTRAELLTEILRHLDLTTPSAKAIRAAMHVEPIEEALPAFVRAFARYVIERYPLIAAVEAAALVDDAARVASKARLATARDMLEVVTRRLVDAGRIDPSWTARRAADWLLARMYPACWMMLVNDLGWSTAAVAEQVLADFAAVVQPSHTIRARIASGRKTGRSTRSRSGRGIQRNTR
jgi:AcrR family transcriptional regulator